MATLNERLDASRGLADTFRIMQESTDIECAESMIAERPDLYPALELLRDASGFDAAEVVQSIQSLWFPTHGYAQRPVLQRYGERERLFEQGYSVDDILKMPSGSFGIPTNNRHERGKASFCRTPVHVSSRPAMTWFNSCGVLMTWLKVAIVIAAFLAIAIVLPID